MNIVDDNLEHAFEYLERILMYIRTYVRITCLFLRKYLCTYALIYANRICGSNLSLHTLVCTYVRTFVRTLYGGI